MAKSPDELPLPEASTPTGVRIKEVPVQPATPRWAKFVIAMLVVIIVGGVVLFIQRYGDAASASRQDDQIASAKLSAARTDCSLTIAGEYEDHRDDVIVALGVSPADGRTAAANFAQFRLGPDGKPESRAARTVRECGSALDAVKSR